MKEKIKKKRISLRQSLQKYIYSQGPLSHKLTWASHLCHRPITSTGSTAPHDVITLTCAGAHATDATSSPAITATLLFPAKLCQVHQALPGPTPPLAAGLFNSRCFSALPSVPVQRHLRGGSSPVRLLSPPQALPPPEPPSQATEYPHLDHSTLQVIYLHRYHVVDFLSFWHLHRKSLYLQCVTSCWQVTPAL